MSPARLAVIRLIVIGLAGGLCATSNTAALANDGACYGTKDGKVYHSDPVCPQGKRIADENRITFDSSTDAEEQGRRLCKSCERRIASGKARASKPTEPQKPAPSEDDKSSGRPPPASQPSDRKRPARLTIDPARALTVTRVLPGGALVLDDGDKIHLLGVCCPEARQPLADEAAGHVEKSVKSRKCAKGWDGTSSQPELRNEHGQLLLYVTAGPTQTDLGGELIAQGLAWVDRDRPCAKTPEYLEREHLAWSEGRGIWKRLSGVAGSARVLAGQYARHYHPTDCPHAVHLNEPAEITVNEAKARRLVPCCFYRTAATSDKKNQIDDNTRDAKKPSDNATRNAKTKD